MYKYEFTSIAPGGELEAGSRVPYDLEQNPDLDSDSENTDIIPNPILLILRNTFRDPSDISNLLLTHNTRNAQR